MEFALTRKQLRKKRGEQSSSPPPETPPGPAVEDGPALADAEGSGFFSSGGTLFGGSSSRELDEPVPPPPPPGFDAAPPAGPTHLPASAAGDRGATDEDALVVPIGALGREDRGSAPIDPERERPFAAAARRYVGFALFLAAAILLVIFLPSLHHSKGTTNGTGLGRPAPRPPAQSALPAPSWTSAG